jgi:CHAT domain-containing protein
MSTIMRGVPARILLPRGRPAHWLPSVCMALALFWSNAAMCQQATIPDHSSTIEAILERMGKVPEAFERDRPIGSIDDQKGKEMLDGLRKDEELVVALLREGPAQSHYALRVRLRLAHIRALVTHEDPLQILALAREGLDSLRERPAVGEDVALRILAARVHLDTGFPWVARDFLSPILGPGQPPAATSIDVDIKRIMAILEDDSPRVACSGRDKRALKICEKLRHLLAVPPARAGVYGKINDFRLGTRRTYPNVQSAESKIKNLADYRQNDFLIPKINSVPLLSFVYGRPPRTERARVLRARPLPHKAVGKLKGPLDDLRKSDSLERRSALLDALRADKAWHKTLGAELGEENVLEISEVRNAPSYSLVIVKSIPESFLQFTTVLVRLARDASRIHYTVSGASLTKHLTRGASKTLDDGIVLSSVGGSGHWLGLEIINPRTARSIGFSEWDSKPGEEENGGYFHGTAHITDLDFDGVAEVILSSAIGDGRYDLCNQCPRRQATSIWKLAPDLSQASRVGEFTTWGDVSFATGGIIGFGPEIGVPSTELTLFSAIRELADVALSGEELKAKVTEALDMIKAYEAAEDPRGAITAYLSLAQELKKRTDAHHYRLVAYIRAARLSVEGGRVDEAKSLIEKVISQFDGTDASLRQQLEEVRFDHARSIGKAGDQFKALAALERAGELSLENVYRKLLYLMDIGDADSAEAVAAEAAASPRFWGKPGSYEVTFQHAVALFRKGDHERSLDILVNLARYASDSPTSKAFSRLYLLGCYIALAREEHAVARHLLDTAIAHMPPDLWTAEGPLLLSAFATILNKNGQPREAGIALDAAVRGGRMFKGMRLAVPLDVSAHLAENSRRLDEALRASNQSLSALTEAQASILSEPHKLSFIQSADQLANQQIARLLRLGAPARHVFEAIESWRAQVLRSVLQERQPETVPKAASGELLLTLQRSLDGRTALVSYFLGGPWPAAVVVTANDVRLVRLPVARDVIRDGRRRLDAEFSQANRKAFTKDQTPPSLQSDLELLHKVLIVPLMLPPEIAALMIVPDGDELYGLPWNALGSISPGGGNGNERRLARQYVISVLPSAYLLDPPDALAIRTAVLVGSTLGVTRAGLIRFMPMYQTSLRRQFGVGFLSRLPGVSKEIGNVETTLRLAGYRLTPPLLINSENEADLVPSFFREKLQGNRIIHVAGHGLSDATDTMASALFLGGNNERGVIRATDLAILDLKSTELVALSACQTGDVSVRAGQEAFGFVRAVLVAGARHAIVSQWSVDDEATQHWFSIFYERLVEYEDVQRAYHATNIEMSTRKTHPFFWAAFTLYSRSAVNRSQIATKPIPASPQVAPSPALAVKKSDIPKSPSRPVKVQPRSGADWRTDVFKD